VRSFLQKLEVNNYEKTIESDQLAKIIKENEEKPTIFNINSFKFPIVSGLVNNREKIALALEIDKTKIISFMIEKLHNLKKCNLTKNAPFLENKINLSSDLHIDQFLPVIDFYKGRRYTTSSIVICDFPGEERQNASFHRMMYLGDNKFSIRIVAQRHLDKAYVKAMEHDKDLKVAVIFGVHPAIEIAAAFSAPNMDELEFASAILNGLDLCHLPNGIFVPSNSEFVIEGRITKDLAPEGPFVDLTGTADKIRQQPILEVDMLYFRDEPLFRTILPGGKEHRMLMGVTQEPRIYKGIQNTIPTVKNVILTQGGCSWLHAVVQIKKRTEGDPKNAIMAALASHPSLKRVIIVDDDIDINISDDIEWAIATRVQPNKDIIFIPNAKGSSLDPSSNDSITCKWGIDATKPLKNNESFNKVEF
jgi:UbiD family decarboxylase